MTTDPTTPEPLCPTCCRPKDAEVGCSNSFHLTQPAAPSVPDLLPCPNVVRVLNQARIAIHQAMIHFGCDPCQLTEAMSACDAEIAVWNQRALPPANPDWMRASLSQGRIQDLERDVADLTAERDELKRRLGEGPARVQELERELDETKDAMREVSVEYQEASLLWATDQAKLESQLREAKEDSAIVLQALKCLVDAARAGECSGRDREGLECSAIVEAVVVIEEMDAARSAAPESHPEMQP